MVFYLNANSLVGIQSYAEQSHKYGFIFYELLIMLFSVNLFFFGHSI